MLRTLSSLVPADDDLPTRAHTIDVRTRFVEGTLYDLLPGEFHQEHNEATGEYIPIAKRAPSVRHCLSATVVRDSVSLLFSEGRFPKISSEDEIIQEWLEKIAKDISLNETFLTAAEWGSVGSVALIVKAIDGVLSVEPMRTKHLTPAFNKARPKVLDSMREQYKVQGRGLRSLGYAIPDAQLMEMFWFLRIWDETAETWFLPWRVSDLKAVPVTDPQRTVIHGLGFCPVVWVRNLPGGEGVDGRCTFKDAMETEIEMDYQMSQGGRGLKYSSAPTLVIRSDDPRNRNEHVVGDALQVPTTGDAKFLEVGGSASAAVVTYCDRLRLVALEAIGGSRSDPDRLSAATSGRAMELMNQTLIWLADRLRTSYGEGALVSTLRMIMKMSERLPLALSTGEAVPKMSATQPITLKWQPWYPPTHQDRQVQSSALTGLVSGGLMSRETAVSTLAPSYDVEDVEAEISRIGADAKERADREAEQEPEEGEK